MQRDMFEGFDSGSFSKAESLNDLDEITIDGRSAMVISNDDDSKIIAIEYLDSSDSEMQEFTHSEFDTLMNKNSVIFEYGGSTSRETPEQRAEQRNFRYLEHEIKQAANIIDTHLKNLEAYSDGDEIFTETDVYPDAIVLDNDVEEKIIYIELDDGEMIELPYEEVAKKFYLDAVNQSYQSRDDLSPYIDLSGKEAVLKYKNNSKIKNVTVEEALNTPIKTVKRYRSDTAPKEVNALKDKHDEIENKLVYKFTPKTIAGNSEQAFPSIYKEGQRGVTGNRWDNMIFIFENEKDADEYVEKKGLIYESEPEYRKRIKKEQKELNKLLDELSDKDNLKDGGALDKEFFKWGNAKTTEDWERSPLEFDDKGEIIFKPNTSEAEKKRIKAELEKDLKDMGKMRYDNGGALDKEFKFDKNFVIYVPSTTDVGSRIRPTDLQSRVNLVEKYVAEKFGGFTRTETDGGYKASSGDIIEEDIVKVSVFAKDFDWNQHEDEVVNKVKEWAKLWGQEAIGFEYEGDLYYIDEEGKFMDGGEVEESLPYTATFKEGGKILTQNDIRYGMIIPSKKYPNQADKVIGFTDKAVKVQSVSPSENNMGSKFGYGMKPYTYRWDGTGYKRQNQYLHSDGIYRIESYAEGGYVYGQKFEDKHGMLILQDRDKYDKDIWTARRYSGESKRNVGIVEVSESELSKMKRIYAEGGEIENLKSPIKTILSFRENISFEKGDSGDKAMDKIKNAKTKKALLDAIDDLEGMYESDDEMGMAISEIKSNKRSTYEGGGEIEIDGKMYRVKTEHRYNSDGVYEPFDVYEEVEKNSYAEGGEIGRKIRNDYSDAYKNLEVDVMIDGDRINVYANRDDEKNDGKGAEFLEEINDDYFGGKLKIENWSDERMLLTSSPTYAEGGEIEIEFEHKGNKHKHTFTPEEEDWWTSFESNGNSYDVHYDEDYGTISVYEYSDKGTDYANTVYSKKIMVKGGEVEMIEIDEDGSNVPPQLMDIFSEFNEDKDPYKEMEKLRAKANEIGYDFSYGLDGTATEFCEIPKKSWGGGIAIGTAVGGYVGYKIGRARKQKYGFETEKKIGRGVKKTFSRKKKMSKGGSISSHFEGELSFLNY